MNDLSLFLYLADVLPSLAGAVSTACGFAAFIAFMLLLAYLFFYTYSKSGNFDADEAAGLSTALSFSRWLFPALLMLCWATYLVPTKETFYAIAVSEVGEEVLKSSEVGKARQALNIWLDKQIEETKAE